MNVETITMDQADAAARFADYEEILRLNDRRRVALSEAERQEYEAARAGYEALAAGTPLVLLSRAILDAPRDEKLRPRLATARADREQVEVQVRALSIVFDCCSPLCSRRVDSLIRSIDCDLSGIWPASRYRWDPYRGFALVPMIPASVRKDVGRLKMSDLWILWEVEEWSDRRLGAEADRDPLLLRHLGGDAYAVLAAWDLTPLERAVMAGRGR